ncbi:MAG: DNA polymerase I, partial [Aeriscardovia sp.]|nr:DNA polymerase I [Aeriscardovia sp.]
VRAAVQTILDTHPLTTYGYKQAIQLAKAAGLVFPRPVFDVQLAAYLTDPDFTTDTIEKTGTHFLNHDFESEAEAETILGAKKTPTIRQNGFDFGADAALLETGQGRAEHRSALLRHLAVVSALETSLKPVLEQRGQLPLLTNIEIPSSAVLAGMEETGAAVNQKRLKDVHDDFAAQANQAKIIAFEAAGPGHDDLNLQSPKQLQQILFAEMGLTGTKKTKTGYSTNATELQKLYLRTVDNERANQFLGALLRYREVNKLKQIVEALQGSVNARDGRIHTTYEQTITATGRLSSTDPNLQNIPNRSNEGREIRSAFVAGAGFSSFLSSDYSQVELRLMAHLSGDEALIEAFRSDADFHRYVASLVYQIPVEEVTAQQRTRVKAMSYGLAYGLSTYGLAQRLNISPAEADVLKEQYFATFGKVHDYLESLVSQARQRGYTETMFGRRRYFPALQSKNRVARAAAERAALNAPIQGSAADIMKMAMVKAAHGLAEAKLGSRIILQIHDELVVELAAGEEEQATAIVRDAMENAVHLDVPLTVSTGVGPDWQSAAH